MKKYIFIIASIAAFSSGCDYVEIPQQAGGSVITPTSDTIRKVFIEDFTGHTCINCPDATRMIDSLSQIYPGQIVDMGIHVNYFAGPCPSAQPYPAGGPWPPGAWSEDFRIPEETDYNATFGTSGFAQPSGMINRSGIFPLEIPTQVADWPSKVDSLLSLPMEAYIKLTPHYNSTSRALTVDVAGEFMKDTTGTYKVELFLIESGLHGYQLDNDIVPAGYNANYDFHNVCRGSIISPGSIQGATVITGTIANHTGISYTSPSFTVPAGYNAANCKIIGILFKDTDYGVLQAAEADMQ
jgi:hypothetical protein